MTKLTKQLSRLISYKAGVISKHSTVLPLSLSSVVVVKVLRCEVSWLLVSVTASQSVQSSPNIPLTVSDNL